MQIVVSTIKSSFPQIRSTELCLFPDLYMSNTTDARMIRLPFWITWYHPLFWSCSYVIYSYGVGCVNCWLSFSHFNSCVMALLVKLRLTSLNMPLISFYSRLAIIGKKLKSSSIEHWHFFASKNTVLRNHFYIILNHWYFDSDRIYS